MNKLRLFGLLLCALAAVLLTVWGSYAWFLHSASMETLMSVLPPDSIVIIPINEADGKAMEELDLDFHEGTGDKRDDDGTIHILRPVCVKSTNPKHILQVVHTTNLNSLSFKLYLAEKKSETEITILTDENGNRKQLTFSPMNGDDASGDPPTLAETVPVNGNYKSGDDVEAHAWPLYWLADNVSCYEKWQNMGDKDLAVKCEVRPEKDPITNEEKDYYATYYFIEIIWKDEKKQTDLFYLMAHNMGVTEG